MKKDGLKNASLLVGATLFYLVLFEVLLRFLVAPSGQAYGSIGPVLLPPVRVLPEKKPPPGNTSEWWNGLVVDGKKITRDDLWGIYRKDAALGYVPKENASSTNAWWVNNNIGARSTSDTVPEVPEAKRRILLFGDSFTSGSRNRQDRIFSFYMEEGNPGWEVVNLGVDGYGTAQSYLRYRSFKGKLDYDTAVLVLVPNADLWRDVNTLRYIVDGWAVYDVMPRFVVEDGSLRLVPSFYNAETTDIFELNAGETSGALREHLRNYDLFYFRSKYEPVPWTEHWVTGKLLAAGFHTFKRKLLYQSLMAPGFEAAEVTGRIVETMAREVKSQGKNFLFVLLPSYQDLEKFRKKASYKKTWKALAADICGELVPCVDLWDPLAGIPLEELDRGADGSHYGPRINRLIADTLTERLKSLNLV